MTYNNKTKAVITLWLSNHVKMILNQNCRSEEAQKLASMSEIFSALRSNFEAELAIIKQLRIIIIIKTTNLWLILESVAQARASIANLYSRTRKRLEAAPILLEQVDGKSRSMMTRKLCKCFSRSSPTRSITTRRTAAMAISQPSQPSTTLLSWVMACSLIKASRAALRASQRSAATTSSRNYHPCSNSSSKATIIRT